LISRHPPSRASILLPSLLLDRLSGSGERNVFIAVLAASTDTLARFANPGMLPNTLPRESAIASIVIQHRRVVSGSHQTVDSVMEANSFVNVTLIESPKQVDIFIYTIRLLLDRFNSLPQFLRCLPCSDHPLELIPSLDLVSSDHFLSFRIGLFYCRNIVKPFYRFTPITR